MANINIQRKPAPTPGIPSTYQYVNCGSGQDYGICSKCGKGHGHIIFQRKPEPKPTAVAIGLRYSR